MANTADTPGISALNLEFTVGFELIGIDFTGTIGYRDKLAHFFIDSRDGKKISIKKVLTGLDKAIGNDFVSSAVLEGLNLIGISQEASIVLRTYFYYNARDGAKYSFEMSLESPKSEKYKMFEITRLGISAANFTPPPALIGTN